MAVTASFLAGAGVLSVFGDSLGNPITVGRNAAGQSSSTAARSPIPGGTPTVANTALIQVFGLAGNDTIRLDETNGPCRGPTSSAAAATTP